MIRLGGLARASRAGFILSLSLIILTIFASPVEVPAAPSGVNFNHIVIVAMENQYYGTILGTGVGASCCTFLASLLPTSSTVLNYHSYCNDGDTDPACPSNPASSSPGTTGACSAACYTALTAGNTYNVYGGLASGSVTATNIFDRLTSAGLTWKGFCEGYCGRKADHFPQLQFSDTYSLTCTSASSENCYEYTDSAASSGNVVAYSDLISEANSASPANYIWFTPTDCHNMHGDTSCTNGCTSYSTVTACASQGDSYLQQLLVGSGSLASPASGSLLSTSLFTNPNSRTLLWIWWDEGQGPGYGLAANLEYGSMIRRGYTSQSNSYDEYSTLQTIENNWNLPCLSLDCNAPVMNDLLPTSTTSLTASFSYSPSPPQTGQLATFTASASGGTSPYAFSWSFGDGSNGTGSSVTHTYSSAGSYAVSLTVKDSGSPQHTVVSQSTVTVSSPPLLLSVSFTFSPSSPSAGQSVSFTGSASGGTSPNIYSWNFGDGSTGTGTSMSHTYSSAGTFTATLTVTDSGSPQQTASSAKAITVHGPPTPLGASFVYSPSTPQVGQLVIFSASASGGTGPYSFSWSFGDGSTGSGISVTHSYSSAGSYMVTLTVKDSNSTQHTATSEQTVSATSPPPPPSASFTFNPSSPTNASMIQFIASASGGTAPYSYSWNFGDLSTAVGPNTEHVYMKTGNYTVTLTITDSTGKTSGTSQRISINFSSKPSSQPPSQPPNNQPSTGGPCILCNLTSLLSTTSLLFLTLFGTGALSVSILLARYNAHNRRLSAILARNASRTTRRPRPRHAVNGARTQQSMLTHGSRGRLDKL